MNSAYSVGFLKYPAVPSSRTESRSRSESDDDITSTCAAWQRLLSRRCFRTSAPVFFGRFRSRRTRAGHGAFGSASAASKKVVAAYPSRTTWTFATTWALFSASRIRKTSVLLSSTMRMSRTFWPASSGREREMESRSFSGFGFDPDPPMITFHNSLAEGKSNAGSRILIARV